jgi:hypothetical protein
MVRRLNWQKRAFDFKPTRALKDEAKRQADADRQRAQASANRAVREKPPSED